MILKDDIICQQGRDYKILENMGNILLLSSYNDDTNKIDYHYLVETGKLSRPFAYADKVYNDGFAPVITEETTVNGSGKPVTKRYIQYYNPSQDLLIETKFDTDHYVMGTPREDMELDGQVYSEYNGHPIKTIVSRRIDWPLLIAKDPINFWFVPTEKLQSKNFVRQCKHAITNYPYSLTMPSQLNTKAHESYHFIRETFFGNFWCYASPFTNGQYVHTPYNKHFADRCPTRIGLKKLFDYKIAAAKAELEAQGIQCGDR